MLTHNLTRSKLWFMVTASFVILSDFTITRFLSSTSEDKLVVYAILFDLMLVVPFLYWLFIVRKSKQSLSKVLLLPIVGAALTWLVLPVHLRSVVWKVLVPFEAILFMVEAAIILYEIRILLQVVRRFRQVSQQEPNPGEALRITIEEKWGTGKLASLVLHDVTMFYYLFFSWRYKHPQTTNENIFSYHRKTSQILMYGIITKVILIEGIGVHLLMQMWSPIAAWIFTIADVWLLILIWADCRASVLNPIKLEADQLKLRVGLRIQVNLPLDCITAISSSNQYILTSQDRKAAIDPIFGTPNVKIELNRPIRVQGILFLPQYVQTIYLALDEPASFVGQIKQTSILFQDSNRYNK